MFSYGYDVAKHAMEHGLREYFGKLGNEYRWDIDGAFRDGVLHGLADHGWRRSDRFSGPFEFQHWGKRDV